MHMTPSWNCIQGPTIKIYIFVCLCLFVYTVMTLKDNGPSAHKG